MVVFNNEMSKTFSFTSTLFIANCHQYKKSIKIYLYELLLEKKKQIKISNIYKEKTMSISKYEPKSIVTKRYYTLVFVNNQRLSYYKKYNTILNQCWIKCKLMYILTQ